MMVRQTRKNLSDGWDIEISETNLNVFDLRVFPHQPFPVLVYRGSNFFIEMKSYSLVPSWSKVAKPKFSTYNARIETIDTKPTWKAPLKSRRCVAPLTSFYESCREGQLSGNIVEFSSVQNKPLAVAAVYDQWIDKGTGEVVDSFAVITRPPTEYISKIGHDRCPLFLSKGAIEPWLTSGFDNATDAKKFASSNFKEPELSAKIERPLKKNK